MEIKKLKEVMQAIEVLQNEKLISEKVSAKYLTEFVAKEHTKKQEEIFRLAPHVIEVDLEKRTSKTVLGDTSN